MSYNKRRRIEESDDEGNLSDSDGIRNDEDDIVDENASINNGNDNYIGNDDDNDEDNASDAEDLVDESMMRDYVAIPELDVYDTINIDNKEYDTLDRDDRLAAEEKLDKRDRRELQLQDWLEVDEDDDERRERRRKFSKMDDDDDDDEAQDDDEERKDDDEEEELEEVNLEAFDVPLEEWIANTRTRREIQRRFRRFLSTFHLQPSTEQQQQGGKSKKGNNNKLPYYELLIKSMARNNESSIEVSYMHLYETEPLLVSWLSESPTPILELFDECITKHTLRIFPSYTKNVIHDQIIRARVSNLPFVDEIRRLRNDHLFKLIRICGVVTRRTTVYPKIKTAYYNCMACNALQGPFDVDDSLHLDTATSYTPSLSCPTCARRNNSSQEQTTTTPTSTFKLNTHKSLYRNYQRLSLQESPGSVPPGRIPRTKEIVLSDDLIDIIRPGEEVEITGIYMHVAPTHKIGFPVFTTLIFANHVRKRYYDDYDAALTDEDKRAIYALAKEGNVAQRIVQSIAPSIYGHEHVKMALALALFGGNCKSVSDKQVRIRGDINILLLGDPGTAKSQFLKYCEKTAPRAVYTTGKGASAVGLTASVRKDPLTKEWTLEGGALVLADRGVCLIDEFDKMNDQDRTSIHEAMEQQSISLSKAGIVTSLQARCSVFAAANPIGGKYDSSMTLSENVELTDPILQRFDILCVLQDEIDPVADERLATFVTKSHMRSKPVNDTKNPTQYDSTQDNDDSTSQHTIPDGDDNNASNNPNVIPQSLLRKYIRYARTRVRPALRPNSFSQEKISSLYVALRKESQTSGGVPIAVRHIESILRMSEAHAKMHLRDYVREDDMDVAIRVMLHSFIQAQKFSIRRVLTNKFAKFITEEKGKTHLLLHILQQMMRNEMLYQTIKARRKNMNNKTSIIDENDLLLELPLEEFQVKARERKIYDVDEFIHSVDFHDSGYAIKNKKGMILIVRQQHQNRS